MNLRNDFKHSNIATVDHLTGSKRGSKEVRTTYCERSKVPIELYKHILLIYENKQQLNLF